jgi:rubrerythrin
MSDCRHQRLVLLEADGTKLRCRHCHLTIEEDELHQGSCPECLHVKGIRRSDFDRVEPEGKGETRYACEDCGTIVETNNFHNSLE